MASPMRGSFPSRSALAAAVILSLAVIAPADETGVAAAAKDTAGFSQAIDLVLTRSYSGQDTSVLLSRIQKKLRWGESDDRLIEAEAVLLWDRGDWRTALIGLQRLSRPGARAMAQLGEGMARKQENYEAAAYFLEAARAFPAEDSLSVAMYRKYLALHPGDGKVELEFAARLETQKLYLEAAGIYARRIDLLPTDVPTALRLGTIMTGLGRNPEALAIYHRAMAANPGNRALAMRLADVYVAAGDKIEAASAMASVWESQPSDTVSRNKAIAILESMGPSGEAVLKILLGKAVDRDGSAHALRFKLAQACLRTGDRDCAYGNIILALAASPGNAAYMALLPEAIEGDDQIKEHFGYLKTLYETQGASMNLLKLVARGFSLTGDKEGSCRAWYQLNTIAPKSLEGLRNPVLDLAACTDPIFMTLASRLAERLPHDPSDADLSRIIIQGSLLEGDFAKASDIARGLVVAGHGAEAAEINAFPQQVAKELLQRDRAAEAKPLLSELARKSPNPETYLMLGRILYAEKNCAEASDPLEAAAVDYPEAQQMLGACLVQLKDFAGAARVYESMWARRKDKESLVALADAYRQAGYGPKEMEVLSTLAQKGWGGEREHLRLGSLYIQQGDSARAEAVFVELLKGKTALPEGEAWTEAAFLVGDRLAVAGKHDKAIHLLRLALKADSTRGASWGRLARCHSAKRQWREAYEAFAAAAALDKGSLELAQAELDAARKLGDKKALLQAYLDVARLDPSGDEASVYLAAQYQAAREYRDAAHYFRKLAAAHPKDAKVWENLGNCLAMIPDLAAAQDPLQTAIDLGAQSDEVFINRARAYRSEGAKDMAASILDFLLTRNPDSYMALLWSAKFADEDGSQPLALELFKKAARQSPPHTAYPELVAQGVQEAQASAPAP